MDAGLSMDFEEKLKLLKKERAARRRPDPVARAWRSIDTEDGLSTKEKLERLIRLTKAEDSPEPRREPDGRPGRRGAFQVFENHYHLDSRYGKTRLTAGLKITGEVLSLLGRDRGFLDRDLNSAVFLDLETTGLSGGVGVVPFLVGVGFYRDDKFHILQFFLDDLAEEAAMIRDIAAFFDGMNFRSVVSYNGKGFDVPLLETRFILHRQTLPLGGLPHLDFLFSARNLWSHKQESCRLSELARDILEAERAEDIPSAEIPRRYFEYLRTGDFSLMEPVLYHNQEDLLSLLGVVILGAGLFAEEGAADAGVPAADAMDWFGVAKVLEKTGDRERSAACIRRALEGRLTDEVALEARKKLAAYFKKNKDWEKAAALWQEMAPLQQLFCFRELAMYHEHRRKDYRQAIAIAEQGLEMAAGVSRFYETDFSHRLERLRARLRRRGDESPE
jgi:uncharacterized protein YprB with RNaseH-like and TPR domain